MISRTTGRKKVKKMPKIIEYFPDWLTGDGIFSYIHEEATSAEIDLEWLTSDTAAILDREYFGQISGLKETSTFVDALVENSDGELTTFDKTKLAETILYIYLNKWKRLYRIAEIEYDPVSNYDMEQTETPNIIHTRDEKRGTQITTSATGSGTGNVYGFNSSNPVPQSSSSTATSETVTGNKDNNTTNVVENERGTRKLTRKGNIGVTTTQQMIESEIALWQWNFFKSVFDDVDEILTAKYYEGRY